MSQVKQQKKNKKKKGNKKNVCNTNWKIDLTDECEE